MEKLSPKIEHISFTEGYTPTPELIKALNKMVAKASKIKFSTIKPATDEMSLKTRGYKK